MLAVVLLQIFLLDNIDLGASISILIRPMIFPLAVLLMPVEWKSVWVLLASYVIALVLDLMLGGSGIYILTLLPIALLRTTLLYATTRRSMESSDQSQLFARMRLDQLMLYVGVSLLIYHTLFFAMETLSMANFGRLVATILLSTLCSLLLSWPIVRLYTSKATN
ncbi:MAG: hypothetical protein IIV76_04925 [Alistipes sp.]|jgi:hypothetical protein|nr:hypothetical protein [Alistipes sp.]